MCRRLATQKHGDITTDIVNPFLLDRCNCLLVHAVQKTVESLPVMSRNVSKLGHDNQTLTPLHALTVAVAHIPAYFDSTDFPNSQSAGARRRGPLRRSCRASVTRGSFGAVHLAAARPTHRATNFIRHRRVEHCSGYERWCCCTRGGSDANLKNTPGPSL